MVGTAWSDPSPAARVRERRRFLKGEIPVFMGFVYSDTFKMLFVQGRVKGHSFTR
jgi:hypothetical protein